MSGYRCAKQQLQAPSQEQPQLSHDHPQIIFLVCLRQSCLVGRKKEIFPCNREAFFSFTGTNLQRSPSLPSERCRGAGVVLLSCLAWEGAGAPWADNSHSRDAVGVPGHVLHVFPNSYEAKKKKNECQVRETPTMTGRRAGSRELFQKELRGRR